MSQIEEELCEDSQIMKIKSVQLGVILVADDSQINLEALKMNLAEIGITDNLIFCNDGKTAIENAKCIIQRIINDDASVK